MDVGGGCAVTVCFLSVSLFFLANRTGIFSEPEYADINVPYGEQIRVILQDGSIVHLNSDSRLRYPKQFGLFNRTVELWGEGYFNVAKDENRPFKVDLQGVEVRVTGTKFNVKAYSAEPNIWITLDEGGIFSEIIMRRSTDLFRGRVRNITVSRGNA